MISLLANDDLNRIVRDFEVTEPADICWLNDREMLETNKSESNHLEAAPGMKILVYNLDHEQRRL